MSLPIPDPIYRQLDRAVVGEAFMGLLSFETVEVIMQTWIALLRGINVGGRNVLPMAKLREIFTSLEYKNVRTYIQSGNVVFDTRTTTASALTEQIGHRLKDELEIQPRLLVLKSEELLASIDANPFPQTESDPRAVHFFFLAQPATNPDIEKLDGAKAETEAYALTDRVFYLLAPDGIGRSKLAANAENYLGVVATARNYRTVDRLRSLITAT